jgi:hypothetical protein
MQKYKLTNSNTANLPSIGPSFVPTSTLNAPGSGVARKRIAVFVGLVDLLLSITELEKDDKVDGAVEEGDP